MNTTGATHHDGRSFPLGDALMPAFLETPHPAPVHDLLVMSHGPGTRPDDRSNHACLNSFASNSRIIEAGG
jgi:hypothetical protein